MRNKIVVIRVLIKFMLRVSVLPLPDFHPSVTGGRFWDSARDQSLSRLLGGQNGEFSRVEQAKPFETRGIFHDFSFRVHCRHPPCFLMLGWMSTTHENPYGGGNPNLSADGNRVHGQTTPTWRRGSEMSLGQKLSCPTAIVRYQLLGQPAYRAAAPCLRGPLWQEALEPLVSFVGLLENSFYRRKFRSESSDNMDRWKAQPGRSSGMEKVRREKIRDGEDQRWRKSEGRRCRCAKR